MRIFNDIVTDDDNVTFSAIKVLAVATVAVALALSVLSFFTGKPFDAQAFGIGMGAVFMAVGGALKLTSPTPPSVTTTSTTTATGTTP